MKPLHSRSQVRFTHLVELCITLECMENGWISQNLVVHVLNLTGQKRTLPFLIEECHLLL